MDPSLDGGQSLLIRRGAKHEEYADADDQGDDRQSDDRRQRPERVQKPIHERTERPVEGPHHEIYPSP